MTWKDECLQWNPSDFFNITSLTLPPHLLWLPLVALGNSRGQVYNEQFYTLYKVRVSSNGDIIWNPGGNFATHCPLNVRKFPFDTQMCPLELECWLYDSQLVHLYSQHEVSINQQNNMHATWQIVDSWTEDKVVQYSGGSFSAVHTYLFFKRKSLYFVLYMVSPCVMLGILNLFLFFLPPTNGEKLPLGMSIIVSYLLFLVGASEYLPQNSANFPLFLIYMYLLMLLAALSVIAMITTANLADENETLLTRCFKKLVPQRYSTETKKSLSKSNVASVHHIDNNSLQTNAIPLVGTLATKRTNRRNTSENSCKILSVAMHLDLICLVIFSLLFSCLTISFFCAVLK